MLWLIAIAPLIMMGSYGPSPKCAVENWKDRDTWKPITPFLDIMCSSHQKTYEAILGSWSDGLHCWFDAKRSLGSLQSICVEYPKDTEICIKNMMEELKPYFNSEETFLSDFMISGHNHTMQHICRSASALKDLEASKSNDEHTCEDDLVPRAIDAVNKCVPKATFYQEMKDIDVIMNKSDFCSTFRYVTTCIVDHLEDSCSSSIRDYSGFLNNIFHSHLDWCNNHI